MCTVAKRLRITNSFGLYSALVCSARISCINILYKLFFNICLHYRVHFCNKGKCRYTIIPVLIVAVHLHKLPKNASVLSSVFCKLDLYIIFRRNITLNINKITLLSFDMNILNESFY